MAELRPYEMKLWSMAPLLMPGDVLLVDAERPASSVRRGEIVVFRAPHDAVSTAHRVVGFRGNPSFPWRTKGDRNHAADDRAGPLAYEGVVTWRLRGRRATRLRWGLLYWCLSVLGLFPGQRIPSWLTRANSRKFFRR